MNSKHHCPLRPFLNLGPALLAALLLCAGAARAQVVADGATRTITTTTAYIGDVTVGTNGSSTLLQILSGGRLTNSAAGYIGLNAGSLFNTVRVSEANSRWHMPSDLAVGNFGSHNTLAVTLGGWVANGGGAIGVNDGANENEVTVISPNSRWDNSGDLYVGFAGAANKLTVSVGGRVANGNGYIGFAADQNQVIVTDPNSLWTNSSSLFVGYFGSRGGLRVANGGRVANNSGYVGFGSIASSNQITVTGAGSLWANRGNLSVGNNGSGNTLFINDGGKVANVVGYIGDAAGANSNTVTVSGPGSLWTNSGNLFVGNSGSFNTLVLTNGGQVANDIGSIGSANNTVTVNGPDSLWTNRGDLLVDGSANTLLISNGGRVVSGGSLIGLNADAKNNQVTVSNTGSLWNAGSYLTVGSSGSSNFLFIVDGGKVANTVGYVGLSLGANNNQATVNGAGSLWTNREDLVVGQLNSFNSLLLTNGGRAANSRGFIGSGLESRNNQVTVTGSGSLWSSGTNLTVGYYGSGNALFISNGGRVTNDYGYLGYNTGAESNQVVVTGPNSGWTSDGEVNVGLNGSFNTLLVTENGLMVTRFGYIGRNAGANNNQATVSVGSLWLNTDDLSVGNSGSGNTLLIRYNGLVANNYGYIGYNTGANNNQVTVTGPYSRWKNSRDLRVGQSGSFNTLIVTNGGQVLGSRGNIGFNADATGNQVTVSGSGSLWTNDSTLFVGNSGSGNTLLLTNGGLVVSLVGIIGNEAGANNNQVIVTSPGSLWTNVSDIRVGRLGSFNTLLIANGSLVQAASATVGFAETSISNVLQLDNGTLTVPGGLTINSSNSLTGSGTINGALTVAGGGIVSPGNSIGKIGLNNPPVLQGQTVMEVSKSGATLTNDQIQVTGNLTYGGKLTVTKFGPEPLVAGNRFQLFNATGGYSGEFASITLPPLEAGLSWANNLLMDGSIVVVNPTPLTISGLTRSGTNLNYNVTGGSFGGPWVQLTSTNVALPLLNWMFHSSGNFDSLGNAKLTNAINFGEPRRFFLITIPADPD